MDAVLFELASGGGVAIDAEEISLIWQGKEPNTAVIERMGYEDTIVVAGDWKEITENLFGYMDLRQKKKKTTPKHDPAKNIIGVSAWGTALEKS